MLPTALDDEGRASETFRANASAWVDRITVYRETLARLRQGGGERAIQRQREKGRLTARERIAQLPPSAGRDARV